MEKIKSFVKKTFFYRCILFFFRCVKLFFAYRYVPYIFNRRSKQPIEKSKAVFIEVSRTELSNNLGLIYNAFQSRGFQTEVHFLLVNSVGRIEKLKRLKKLALSMATAGYVFITEGSDLLGGIKIRPETVYSQVWHGCGAFKKFGFLCADKIFGTSKEYMQKHPSYAGYTNVFVSSETVVDAYERAMGFPHGSKIVKPLGVSRTDVFFDRSFIEKAKQRLSETVVQSKNKKVILYAPTFRGFTANAYSPEFLNPAEAAKALSKDYVLLIKHHPHVKKRPQIPDECRDFAFDVTDTLDIDTLLCVSDICVSDYSSLIFEFSLFERPMIFLAPDKDEYIDWRGFFYDYSDFTPGKVVNTTAELIAEIKRLENGFDSRQVKAFKEKFMSACDGHSTERILNCVFGENQ